MVVVVVVLEARAVINKEDNMADEVKYPSKGGTKVIEPVKEKTDKKDKGGK
jgi:hypothetical protein